MNALSIIYINGATSTVGWLDTLQMYLLFMLQEWGNVNGKSIGSQIQIFFKKMSQDGRGKLTKKINKYPVRTLNGLTWTNHEHLPPTL